VMPGTGRVRVIGVGLKHSSQGYFGRCPTGVDSLDLWLPAHPVRLPARELVDPQQLLGKVVIFVWHGRHRRCPSPECDHNLANHGTSAELGGKWASGSVDSLLCGDGLDRAHVPGSRAEYVSGHVSCR
jgi:hypothetical protein